MQVLAFLQQAIMSLRKVFPSLMAYPDYTSLDFIFFFPKKAICNQI